MALGQWKVRSDQGQEMKSEPEKKEKHSWKRCTGREALRKESHKSRLLKRNMKFFRVRMTQSQKILRIHKK